MNEGRVEMSVGEYVVVRPLGKGGMSEVFEVENRRLGSRYALKMFAHEKNGESEEVLQRFRTEGRLLAKLSHPRIVKVVDFGNDPESGAPYFVMDLILDAQGEVRSLANVEPGTVDEETIGRWYDDIREGLDYIHGKGVVHRDLKLQNILIGPDGHAVLTDFGISRILDVKDGGGKVVDTVNTIIKMKEGRSLVMGSIGYMAPELEMGVAASPQSDWYALGVIVYRLLTGTWCDARTDVVGALETYGPVWQRIIPKLLHSNPNGRVCLSYAQELRIYREKAELEAEARWLREKGRGHFARHLARWLAVALLGLAVVLGFTFVKHDMDRKFWLAENLLIDAHSGLYDFDRIFKIPPAARSDEQIDESDNLLMPSRDDLAAARIDLLVITHDLFSELNRGVITLEKAIHELEWMREGFDSDATTPFDRWPDGYFQVGNEAAIAWMLDRGLEAMREMAEH